MLPIHYYGCFIGRKPHLFRLDTRVYLEQKSEEKDLCVAAVIAKNPGSAEDPGSTTFDGGPVLRIVRNRFRYAYERAEVPIPRGAYVRVWNLFYLCNPKLKDAIKTYSQLEPQLCPTEDSDHPTIVWFAWGPPKLASLNQMKERFLGREFQHPFYYDIDRKAVIEDVPGAESRVKHPQGLPGDPIERHIASILRKQGSLAPNQSRSSNR